MSTVNEQEYKEKRRKAWLGLGNLAALFFLLGFWIVVFGWNPYSPLNRIWEYLSK